MIWGILAASALLLAGFTLRATMRPLQVLFVPASVIGGILGLIALQVAQRVDAMPAGLSAAAATLGGELKSWPGFLIAVVFAGLLLEKPARSMEQSVRGAALAGIMVWIIVLGQVAIGLAATWLIIRPLNGVPPAFGQLIEAGFAGGHGTATALGTVYQDVVAFPDGLDLALFVATFGLVYSVISGILFVNIGVRRGWTRGAATRRELIAGLEDRAKRPPIAFGTVRGEVIDPLVFQIVLLAMALLLGVLFREAFTWFDRLMHEGRPTPFLQNIPLFLFALLGGLALRKGLAVLRLDDLIDGESIKRLVAVAMEFLIVAAVASLRIETVVSYAWPLALLLTLGAAWTAVCLFVLSPRLLPADRWFELGIINYGMSTGTTAQGMMLLRIVDPDLESGAAEDYALAAPLSAPFVGGGVLTLSMPLLLGKTGLGVMTVILAAGIVVLWGVGRKVRGRVRGG